MAQAPTINLRYRIGPLGKTVVAVTPVLNRVGIRLPERFIGWAICRSSFISINNGPWERANITGEVGTQ